MKWGHGWEVGLNKEIESQFRAALRAEGLSNCSGQPRPVDTQRQRYLRKRCYCGSGLGDGLCVNCWPR